MYLFPDYNDIHKPGSLKNFVADLHSGKLHREFHNGPDSTDEKSQISAHNDQSSDINQSIDDNRIDVQPVVEPSPPDSTFIKLAPSEKRYTLLRNEL